MSERKPFTITWKIKNFSFCWQKKEEELPGPKFSIEGMEGSKWTLYLFPRATISKENGSIAFYLYRECEENGPYEVEIDYELSALGCDGLPLETASFTNCKIEGNNWSLPLHLKQKTVFHEKPDKFLPNDSLTVRCRIRQIGQEKANAERYFATKRIEVEKSLLFGIVKRSDRTFPGKRYHVQFVSTSTETPPIFIKFRYLEDTMNAEIYPANYELLKLCKCKLKLTDDEGNQNFYGEDQFLYHYDTVELDNDLPHWTFPLKVTSTNNSNPFPVMEHLTLRGEIIYSTGIMSETFGKVDYSISTFQNGCRLKEKRQENIPSVTEDLYSLAKDAESYDIEIETKNKIFPAHKIVLSAGSLFFKNIITNNEDIGRISVDDLDNDTLYQMLVFLYTETIENVKSKAFINLYIASELYGIPSLKQRCSCFLQSNIDAYICWDALKAADRYRDKDLKQAAMNYISKHGDEIFDSDKWRDLERYTELREEVLQFKRIKNQDTETPSTD